MRQVLCASTTRTRKLSLILGLGILVCWIMRKIWSDKSASARRSPLSWGIPWAGCSEKAELIDKLLISLDKPDAELEAAWAEEAESRIDAYERGEIETVALEKVFERYNNLPNSRIESGIHFETKGGQPQD